MYSIEQLWINVRSSLWFVPSLLVVGAILLAFGLIQTDEWVDFRRLERWPRLFGAGVEGSRGMLTAIATSIITVAGVTFSITVVALAQASSQYSPLVLRNFMRDRGNQTVLGVFGGIFVYCLVVLRSVGGGEEAFVPRIAVFVALLHAVAAIGFLLYFIHHIATVLQASSVLAMVEKDTLKAIDDLFREELTADDATEEQPQERAELRDGTWHPVRPHRTGYVQAVRSEAMMSFACERNAIVRMEHGIGDFVVAEVPIASVALEAKPDEATLKAVKDFFIIGEHRTIDQDPAFGIRQIVDMAVKALSPAINDSTTACSCVNYLAAILIPLAPRRLGRREHHADGKLRVMATAFTFADLVHLAFDEIIRNARSDPTVLACLVETIRLVALHTGSPSRRRVLVGHLAPIAEHATAALTDRRDKQSLQRQIASALQEIEAAG